MLLLHQDVIPPQTEPCDLAPVAARYDEAERRRISAQIASIFKCWTIGSFVVIARSLVSGPGFPAPCGWAIVFPILD